jgi:hypothetical protein
LGLEILVDRFTSIANIHCLSARKLFCQFFSCYHKPVNNLFTAISGRSELASGIMTTNPTEQISTHINTFFITIHETFIFVTSQK